MVDIPKYRLIYTKQALKDIPKLKAAKLDRKVQKICEELSHNPFKSDSKKLRKWKNRHSIPINQQHRLVYELYKDIKTIHIIRMWTHYEDN